MDHLPHSKAFFAYPKRIKALATISRAHSLSSFVEIKQLLQPHPHIPYKTKVQLKSNFEQISLEFLSFNKNTIGLDAISYYNQFLGNSRKIQMERKIINQLTDFPKSEAIGPIKDVISKLLLTIPEEKKIESVNKEMYTRVLKQIQWGLSKVNPCWPEQVERMMENLKKHLLDFHQAITQPRGSSIICGSSKGKDADRTFMYVLGFQQVFPVIGHYQDKNIKQDLISNVLSIYEKQNNPRQQPSKVNTSVTEEKYTSKTNQTNSENCQNCKLYLSLSLQPNGSLAKSILKKLPNNQWIMGILHQQGKIFPQDIPKAAQYYQKAAMKNNPDSIYRLGSLNQRGDYGKPYQYFEMWKKAAQMGNLEAMTDMGFVYEKGVLDDDTGKVVIQKNSTKAYQYYSKASKQNFPRGLNNLGSFYQTDPVYKNKQKSIQCLNKAIDAGYVKAMFNLGLCYYQGYFGTPDSNKARDLFKRAADLGDNYSKLFYVDILLNGDTSNCSEDQLEEVNKFCRQMIAEEEDRAQAYYFLGIMHESGLGAPQQPKTAFFYFMKAAKYNYVHGYIKLADCYRTGFGVEQDQKQALKLYQEASRTKPEALVNIGMIYEQGSDIVPRNYDTAFKYYFEACNRNVIQGYNKLGNCYKMGRGCKKDQNKARQYFQKFQKLNSSQSYVSKTNLMQSQSSVSQSSQVYPRKRN